MFNRLAILAIVGFCCLSVRAEPPKHHPATAPSHTVESTFGEPKHSDAAILEELEKYIPEVNLRDIPLSDAIDYLRDQNGLQIFVNWKSLEAAGIDRSTPITLHLKGKRTSTVLRLMLAILGAEKEEIGFGIDNDVVVISTAHDLAKNTTTRVFDVRPVIEGPGGAGRAARVELVLKLVTESIDPQSWKSRGGELGSIRELQGQLIVTQIHVNQAKIATLIKNLVALAEAAQPAK